MYFFFLFAYSKDDIISKRHFGHFEPNFKRQKFRIEAPLITKDKNKLFRTYALLSAEDWVQWWTLVPSLHLSEIKKH